MDTTPILPGKLGNPEMLMKTDPRADPRMVAAMAPMGLDGAPEPAPVDINSATDALLEFAMLAEEGFGLLSEVLCAGAPPVQGVQSRTEIIRGVDGNDVTLFIHTPTDVEGPLPCIFHTHGGGMAILEASGAGYVRGRDELAATGLVVVGVEFRNSAGKLGPHPFPAGLNDCASGLQWTHENREALGISKIVISGESGGGNLALATTLKAKQDGFLDTIDGVYAQCPYISGVYADKDPALPSLWENDDYFLNCSMMGSMVRMYSPDGADDTNPLAWPYHASVSDLEGLPPHVISVNQLDPLRDEGLAYFQKLLAAGVSTSSRTVNGTCHAGDCLLRDAMPEVYLGTVRDINSFANSL
jgi:acetyl esterase